MVDDRKTWVDAIYNADEPTITKMSHARFKPEKEDFKTALDLLYGSENMQDVARDYPDATIMRRLLVRGAAPELTSRQTVFGFVVASIGHTHGCDALQELARTIRSEHKSAKSVYREVINSIKLRETMSSEPVVPKARSSRRSVRKPAPGGTAGA